MSDMRAALYVYEKGPVTIAPEGLVDLYRMADDYSAEFVQAIDEPTTIDLVPGVYGYAYRGKAGISEGASRVRLVLDVQKKHPWPQPPPPPPGPYLARRDWSEHTRIFMSPLGFDESEEGATPEYPVE